MTPILALIDCGYGLTRDLPKDQPNCIEGAVIFLPIGYFMTIIALVISIYYCRLSFKINKD